MSILKLLPIVYTALLAAAERCANSECDYFFRRQQRPEPKARSQCRGSSPRQAHRRLHDWPVHHPEQTYGQGATTPVAKRGLEPGAAREIDRSADTAY